MGIASDLVAVGCGHCGRKPGQKPLCYCTSNKIAHRKAKPYRHHVKCRSSYKKDNALKQRIMQMYQAGIKRTEIARECDCSYGYVYAVSTGLK